MEIVVNSAPVEFVNCSHKPELFLDILPEDWRTSLLPYPAQNEDTTEVYVLIQAGEVLAGGLVFHAPAPDTLAYKAEAQKYFDAGYRYIGYLWVKEALRGRQLGTFWLNKLFDLHPGQKYWLAIEDIGLEKFYKKSGFIPVKPVDNAGFTEWIMLRN